MVNCCAKFNLTIISLHGTLLVVCSQGVVRYMSLDLENNNQQSSKTITNDELRQLISKDPKLSLASGDIFSPESLAWAKKHSDLIQWVRMNLNNLKALNKV